MEMVKITSEEVETASQNWLTVFPEDKDLHVFFDFLDPVRQTDLKYFLDWAFDDGNVSFNSNMTTLVNTQIARRIEMLLSPHFHTILKANWKRAEYAKKSWGKKLPWK